MAFIIHPPRAFQVTLQLLVPPEARSDEEMTAYFLQSISPSLALSAFQPRVAIGRIAALTLGTEVPR